MSNAKAGAGGIAVVGMAGRFPKARNLEEFWRNLCAGVEGISFFSDAELEAAGGSPPKENAGCVKARGLLEGAELFDAAFFGVNPREAEIMDPQHRVFLECAWEALENAGLDPARFDGAIGVFAGASMNTYLARNLSGHPGFLAQFNEHQLMVGNDKDFLPTRVSYKLNLRGPSINVQTACSTSLVAVCLACQNLLNYDCDAALAGAVSIMFPQKRGYHYQEGGIASPDGHCRAFDARSAGTVAGEGAGIVVLRRLEDALADGDSIYGVIRGFAVNNDGANKAGFTAPSVEGQAEVIATAQAMAGFGPETIGYIETHGTGTPLGDPIEIEGLSKAFRAGTAATGFCAIGSVKSSIGHLDTAAGVTGLIKTVLALHHGKIPASLHFESPNPHIDFANSPFHVNARLTDWKPGATPRRAGVSSFGMGGTNAHVVLEEAPAAGASSASRPAQLLLLSAKTEAAIDQATANLAGHLKQTPGVALADVAHTLQTGRQSFAHRRALVCRDAEDALAVLEARDPKRILTRACQGEAPPVVFMFPGQGAQQVDMARDFYMQEPVFREQVDRCCELLKPHLGLDLRTVLYPVPQNREEAGRILAQTAVTQPALFVVEYALAQLWLSWGVRPESMIGHSVGEYVAACLAGVFDPAAALALIAARGRLMQAQPAGTMLAVRLPESGVQPLLTREISLAAVNAPSVCVVSGPADALERLQLALKENGAACTPLDTSHAFHSGMMEPVVPAFTELVEKMRLAAPKIPFISSLTGTWISAEQATDPGYWASQLRHPVRFADGIGELLKLPARLFLETGPGQTLSSLARQHPARGASTVIVPSLRHPKDSTSDIETALNAMGQLWLSGVGFDWKAFYKNEKRRRIRLPAYPFERKRYFIEPAKSAGPAVSPGEPGLQSEPAKAEEAGLPNAGATAAAPVLDGQVESLRLLLAGLSGLAPTAISTSASFTEMGLDSLFLTQLSVVLSRRFGITVAFRRLLQDLSSLEALAAHLTGSGRDGHTVPLAQARGAEAPPVGTALIPLTEPQRELWFASEMSDAASCAYNECRLLHLRGDLKENTLLAAIQSLANRHEALRTTFAPGGDVQQVQSGLAPDVPLLDWSRLAANTQTSRLDALLDEEARLPFNLISGPPLRAWLIRLHDQHHLLVLTVHHIVCDGHSVGILLRELAALYSADCRGVPAALPAPLQWSEYARGQSQRTSTREADEAFWLKQYASAAPVLELPADHPRPSTRTFEGARESRRLPARLGAELKGLAARRGATLFSTLLGAYAVLLQKLSGQDEVVVGIPIADRAVDHGESLVGHCINFLPVRLKLDPDESFEACVARVQNLFLEAHEHQGFTFGSLIQKLNLPRDPGRMPLVSATFNSQRMEGKLHFADLEAELVSNPRAFTHFDLGFNVTEINGALLLECRYNKSLFAGKTIRRWLGHFQKLLENAAEDPRKPVSALPLLSLKERNRLLNQWSGPQTRFPADQCAHQLFEEQAARTPEAVALVFEDQRLSYAALNHRANHLAHRLRALGVGPEVLVGVCLERSLDMVVGILAVLKAGGAYVPMEPSWPAERRAFVLQDTQARVLVTHGSLRSQPEFGAPNLKCICPDDGADSQNRAHDENPESGVRPEHLAYVIYTSGSTGRPKGVMVTHQNLARLFHATQPWYRFNQRDVWTLFHSYAFDFSVWEIWGALVYGGRLVVVPYLTTRSPELLLGLLTRERVTVLNQTPSAFRQLVQAERRNARPGDLALRLVIFGGEALEMRTLQSWFERHSDWQPQLVNMYGITETTVHVTYRPVSVSDLEGGSVIGAPIPDLQIYILDPQRLPVPVGVTGELYVGGAGVARGYLNRPELTAERFIPHPFVPEAKARLYKTGDLARWLPDGDIEYLGRADHQVKLRGHRIELGEVEAALASHPAVDECVVLVREDSPGDQRLAAYFVAQPDKADVSPDELRAFLKAKLPDYMVPQAFVPLDAMPLTQNGKADRKSLPAPEQSRTEAGKPLAAPATPTETALADIWCEVLHLERVGVHDNFFDLGGHSLSMTQAISRLRDHFQVEFPMRKFFESPTIAQLSSAIEEMVAEEISRLSDEEVRSLAHQAG